eukprot:scaffold1572_cov272-Pinguiococcus_pyrenoidosus.AAC.4
MSACTALMCPFRSFESCNFVCLAPPNPAKVALQRQLRLVMGNLAICDQNAEDDVLRQASMESIVSYISGEDIRVWITLPNGQRVTVHTRTRANLWFLKHQIKRQVRLDVLPEEMKIQVLRKRTAAKEEARVLRGNAMPLDELDVHDGAALVLAIEEDAADWDPPPEPSTELDKRFAQAFGGGFPCFSECFPSRSSNRTCTIFFTGQTLLPTPAELYML